MSGPGPGERTCPPGAVLPGAARATGVALAGPVELHGADVDPAAVRCAGRNIGPLGGEVLRPRCGPCREARLHEPRVSRDNGTDGLQVQRLVAAGARHWLAPGGRLLVETSPRLAQQTAVLFLRHGLTARVATAGELDATVVIGTPGPGRPAPRGAAWS